ncbi:hypothetical protein [Candidatus Finniella inopinata]|uniref:Uncharacterized protein n=1 Tax=Candidatus Finniella inopinata TaxID=1696036 RepID=A0A4Q7DEY7_9PROT|nr:hypothetical protein [Candidatus Finniella inopinata]RZI45301.1 hypothetical protein EQU50_07630 [Candidatus Finniella inopinata]
MSRKTVVINQSLDGSNTWSVNMAQLGITFNAKKVTIKQIIYCNIAGADSGIYLISSSLTSEVIGAFYIGIDGVVSHPETIINLYSLPGSISFSVTPANAAFAGPTGQLCLTLEFEG